MIFEVSHSSADGLGVEFYGCHENYCLKYAMVWFTSKCGHPSSCGAFYYVFYVCCQRYFYEGFLTCGRNFRMKHHKELSCENFCLRFIEKPPLILWVDFFYFFGMERKIEWNISQNHTHITNTKELLQLLQIEAIYASKRIPRFVDFAVIRARVQDPWQCVCFRPCSSRDTIAQLLALFRGCLHSF